ncbi:uncharacterized protein N7498_009113 [Penicillium cinerascens]|uniref:Uncharacterized protein n=1 Tax=Penicillium cinerascens TaxID=70096 RepID=A0A9W9J4Y5_9EURO|nr:uncharacterized protein N7498_009113 [Penicillium cinerascens]KAJ5190128.1 hypothetical protein N7498_009113 [Penicillium cinerascens]
MMSSQIKRDFDEVTEAIDFFQTLCNLPGWSDPETSVNLCKSVAMRIYSVDEANVGWLKGTRDEYKSKVLEEQKKGYVDDVLKALQGPAPSFATDVISLEPEQLTALRSFLDTEAKIRALYKLFSDSEWSKDPEGLAKEKEVLSSILNDASVQRLLFEAIMKTFLTKSKVVEVIASIRNEVFSSWKAAANEEEFYDRYSGAVRHYDKNIKEENEESAADAYKNYDVREWSSSPYFSRYYDAGYF